jgi:hypothetical protein
MTEQVGERKILYSPGYGAGWVSWNGGSTKDVELYMLTYEPIIKAIEDGTFDHNPDGPLCNQLKAECLKLFGANYICTLGARDLTVATVHGRVRITEYDGAESYDEEDTYEGWL